MTTPLTLTSLPLFPLHTVLFPGGHLPLRVFEVRYRTMVRQCREAGAPFGVVTLMSGEEVLQPGQPHEQFHTVGTMAKIDSVAPLSAGLELLQCTGTDRFTITATRRLTHGLWVADVELIPGDLHMTVPDDLRHSASALQQVMYKIPNQHLASAPPGCFQDCGWVANRWCELLPMAESLQLRLLSLQSPLLRLELVTDVLERSGIVF